MQRWQCIVPILLMSATACSTKPTDPNRHHAAQPPPETFDQRAKALIGSFKSSLKTTLQETIAAQGPAAAVETCHTKAPQITAAAQRAGLELKRIGTRTRNPENQPSQAESMILGMLSKEHPEHRAFIDGHWIFAEVIFVEEPVCLLCHGDKKQLAPDIRQMLAKRYPNDAATGYQLGDLRGAFIVHAKEAP